MPPIMEGICEGVLESEPGEFNWEVLEEPSPEQEDEMEELNALLSTWVPTEPSVSKEKEVVKVEGGLEAGKLKSRSRGQKHRRRFWVKKGRRERSM
jgi:hypothetical protein